MAYKDIASAIKYNNDYNKQAYDRISLMVPKGRKEEIKAEAIKHGESINAFINRAIDQLMNAPGGTFHSSGDGNGDKQ